MTDVFYDLDGMNISIFLKREIEDRNIVMEKETELTIQPLSTHKNTLVKHWQKSSNILISWLKRGYEGGTGSSDSRLWMWLVFTLSILGGL